MTRPVPVEVEPADDGSPFDRKLPVIRAGSPEFAAFMMRSAGVR